MLSVHELILSLETFHLAPSWRHYSIEEAELCCTWGPTSLPVTSRQDVVRHFSAKAKNVYVLRRVWQQLRKKVAIGDGRCDVTNMCVCVSKKTLTSRVEQVFRALWLVQICSSFVWHWSLDARVRFVHPSYCQVTVNKTLLHVLGNEHVSVFCFWTCLAKQILCFFVILHIVCLLGVGSCFIFLISLPSLYFHSEAVALSSESL